MPSPLISVITVCYNAAPLIEETILSVLGQDYPNLEYLIVDGASTDGTLDIVRKYADRVKFVSEPDKGIYDAMNKGLKKATGEWVNFMNAGDYFANDHVLSDIFGTDGQLNLCDKDRIRIIGGNTLNVFPDGHIEEHHAELADVIPERLPFSHQASFVRILPNTPSFDLKYKYAADYKMFYDLYFTYGKEAFLVLKTAIAKYRQEDSLTMNPQNQHKIKGEYLSIQSAHRSLHWWKEYLKWRLL